MPVYPGAPSGSHRSPSHTRTTTRPAQPTTASWRAIKSRSEAVSTRNAHPRARDPAALRCKPFIVRSRRGAPTVQLLSLLRTSPPMPNHSDPDIPKQSDAQQADGYRSSSIQNGPSLSQTPVDSVAALICPGALYGHVCRQNRDRREERPRPERPGGGLSGTTERKSAG
jgi:hypothetical protein